MAPQKTQHKPKYLANKTNIVDDLPQFPRFLWWSASCQHFAGLVHTHLGSCWTRIPVENHQFCRNETEQAPKPSRARKLSFFSAAVFHSSSVVVVVVFVFLFFSLLLLPHHRIPPKLDALSLARIR